MKKILLILSVFIVLSCKGNDEKIVDSLAINSTTKQQNKLKRYDVKSGIVKYKITISGGVLGGTVSGNGTENLYFKDWGAVELVEENSTQTTKMKIFGKENINTTNTHTIKKLDNGESYHVDFDSKTIYLRRDLAMDLMIQTSSDAGKTGKSMLESIGGKKIGNELIKGYNCEIWDVNGAKQWMYKGVVLRLEITVMGIKTVREAVTADFNTMISDYQLKLPNFPIKKEEGFLNNEEFDQEMATQNVKLEQLSKMSYSEWKNISKQDEEMQNMSEEELRQAYNMMQKMIKARLK